MHPDPMGELPREVEFDDGPSDRMTVEWASRGMRWLKKNRPLWFAEMMQRGVFGIEPKPGRRS